MAITWTVTITPTDIENKIAAIRAVRVDDVAVTEHIVTVRSADLSTGPKRAEVLDIIWAKYQAQIVKEAQIAAVIGTLETDAKANLEGRE